MGASGAGGGTSASATDAASDMTAFMATFATMKDPVFLLNAASSNMLEIKAGQMASQKATNADVRKYAQMMVSHHTKSTQELKAVATPLGVTMPQTMMPVHQALADRLMNKTGKDFDEAYMDVMEAAHKMDIAMFEVKSKAAETPTVQQFATKTLPMLRSHHTMADGLEKKVD
jgi:putative membrane protein